MTDMDTTRRRDTRRRLIEAAIVEFGQNGIDATSVEQLCEAAGFSRGAFYSNFTSKDDLCIALARQVTEEATARFLEVLAAMPAEIGREAIMPAILDAAHPSPELHATQIQLTLRASQHPEFGARLRETRSALVPLYLEVAEQAAMRARVRFKVPAEDVVAIVQALYYSPRQVGSADETMRLIGVVSRALVERLDDE